MEIGLYLKDFLVDLNQRIFDEDHQENDFAPTENPGFCVKSPRFLLNTLNRSINDLLQFKLNITKTDYQELEVELEKLENCMRTRESDVRKHLRAQYELRVLIEEKKWNLETLENREKVFRKETRVLEDKINTLKVPKKFDQKKIKKDMEEKIEDIKQTIQAKNEKIFRIQKENEELKKRMEEKIVELNILKKEKRRISNLTHLLGRCPGSASVEELKPGPECCIFLSPLLEKIGKPKNGLQPKLRRGNTTTDLNVFGLLEGNERDEKKENRFFVRKNVFHKRSYTKVDEV